MTEAVAMKKAENAGEVQAREIGSRSREGTTEGMDIVRSILVKTPPLPAPSPLAVARAVCSATPALAAASLYERLVVIRSTSSKKDDS